MVEMKHIQLFFFRPFGRVLGIIAACLVLLFGLFGVFLWIATHVIWPGRACTPFSTLLMMAHVVLFGLGCAALVWLLRERRNGSWLRRHGDANG